MKSPLFTVSLLALLAGLAPLRAEQPYPLSSLNLKLMQTEFDRSKADRSVSNKPLSLKGKEYKGVGTHAESKMIINLAGKAKSFTALVGVDDNAGGPGTVVFKITGDGKELYNSGLLKMGEGPKKVDVSLKGVKKLLLEALNGGDGNKYDHADWAEAVITMDDGKPMAIPECDVVDISTPDTTFALQIDKDGNVFQQYLGKKAEDVGDLFERGSRKDLAYPTINSNGDFQFWGEPDLHVIHEDGHMITVLKHAGTKQEKLADGSELTTVSLKDPNYPFHVDLFYKTWPGLDVVEQWTEIRHNEKGPVQLQKFASSALTLESGEFWLTHFSGGWANEFNVNETKLTPGSKSFENKWGITSSNEFQQHYMLSMDGKATETEGKVIAATLAWSGNYKMQFELKGNTLIATAGINPWASNYTLQPGETFTTPKVIYAFSDKGKGEASRRLHRWAMVHGLRDGEKPMPVLFNNWEATGMNTSDKTIVPFFKPARELGFELFLLDDGWFGLPDKARVLGEWDPSPVMHPKGMSVLINEAGKVGIDFGLWVEMEMANPDARLVKNHPDWLLTEPNRPKHLQRGQYVLDLSNPEVQKFCINSFNKILKENPGIRFVKWDCNSPFHNPWSSWLGKNQQHLWIDYTKGLYKVFSETVKANPELQMMLCSAGGARSDYGSLQYFHDLWTSDNTNAMSRVFIQWGYSHIFPAKALCAHVTHMGHHPFKFAFDVAMSGTLGMDADPTKMTEEEKTVTKRAVEVYKTKLRPVVQFGEIYRLQSPYETSRAALMYVTPKDRKTAAVFVYQVKDDSNALTLKLQGLDPEAKYKVEEVNIDSPASAACKENGSALSGRQLMDTGLTFSCKKHLDSAVIYLNAQ